MRSGVSRAVDEPGFVNVLSRIAMVAMLVGAAGSIRLMLHAGSRQQSRVLMLLFGAWVLFPFVAALVTSSLSRRWAVVTRATLYTATVVLTLCSLAIYGSVAFGYAKAKVGFVFLVVPLVSSLLAAIGVGTAALISGRQSRQSARVGNPGIKPDRCPRVCFPAASKSD